MVVNRQRLYLIGEPLQKPQPPPQKSDEGSIEEDHHERLYGESQEFGDSQGYDMSVDSNQLEKYDYFEDVKK